MNSALRTNITAAARTAGVVALVCAAAAASLVALSAAVGSVRFGPRCHANYRSQR
jgi:hypothetical protein